MKKGNDELWSERDKRKEKYIILKF